MKQIGIYIQIENITFGALENLTYKILDIRFDGSKNTLLIRFQPCHKVGVQFRVGHGTSEHYSVYFVVLNDFTDTELGEEISPV